MQSTFYLLWRVFGTRDYDAVVLTIMTFIPEGPDLKPVNLWPPLLQPAFLRAPYTIIRPPHLLNAVDEASFEKF
jgi:hypothetical protein